MSFDPHNKAAGICVECGVRQAAEGHSTCHLCLEKARVRWKRHTDKTKANGLCQRCGMPNDRADRLTCSTCARIESIKHRQMYQDRVANGLCTKCGRRLVWDKSLKCEDCQNRANEQNKGYRKCGKTSSHAS